MLRSIVFSASYGVHVSVNDFIIKAVASALKMVPEANGMRLSTLSITLSYFWLICMFANKRSCEFAAHWDEKTGVVSGTSIDISIAVATEKVKVFAPLLENFIYLVCTEHHLFVMNAGPYDSNFTQCRSEVTF